MRIQAKKILLRFPDLLKSTKLRKHCTTPLLFFQSLNDFTYCFICLPLETFRWYSRGDVYKLVGKGFCDIWPIMGFSIVGISYWNLCLISTNRNLAMYDPKLGKAISFSYIFWKKDWKKIEQKIVYSGLVKTCDGLIIFNFSAKNVHMETLYNSICRNLDFFLGLFFTSLF